MPIENVRVHRDARLLARFVRPHQDTLGLSVPAKMQWVLEAVGRPRIYAAALAAGVTRPFGFRGMFYRIAGDPAREIDGGVTPYEGRLFPPFESGEAQSICNELEEKLDTGVAIVDINDFGGTIRATSRRALPARALMAALADNPLRQRSTGIPLVLVRPA